MLDGTVTNPEIEDLLRTTLASIAKDELGHELPAVTGQTSRSMASILKSEKLSKYQLAKAFVRYLLSNYVGRSGAASNALGGLCPRPPVLSACGAMGGLESLSLSMEQKFGLHRLFCGLQKY